MRIGIADTTFARYDMGKLAKKTIEAESTAEIVRYTVPGIKDLPVAAKRLLEEHKCDVVLALGMPGRKPIDKQCAREASMGIIQAQLMANKHIIEVFVHEDEAKDDAAVKEISIDRTKKHALNALKLLKGKDELTGMAGTGQRQGSANAKPL